MDSNLLTFLVISDNVWGIIKIAASFVFGGLGLAIFQKVAGKKKEALELAKLTADGQNVLINIKTNIDTLVEQKTKALNDQVADLQQTIINISTKYTKDLNQYVDRMAAIDQRLDDQSAKTEKTEVRNTELEKNLEAEMELRKACIAQLKNLQERVYQLEKVSPDIPTPKPPDPHDLDNLENLKH